MFSHSRAIWKISKSNVLINHGREGELVPQYTLRHDPLGVSIILKPVRTIFESCIPFDNNLQIEIRYDYSNKNKNLTENASYEFFDMSSKKCQSEVKKKLTQLEDEFANMTSPGHKHQLEEAFDVLYNFSHLPKRNRDAKVPVDKTINDMVNSAFGQGSHTAKLFAKRLQKEIRSENRQEVSKNIYRS